MNRLLFFALVVASVCCVNCFRFTPLCQNSVFNYQGKEVNGFVNLSMGVSFLTDDLDESTNGYKSNSHISIEFVKPSMALSEDGLKEQIRKLIQKKPQLDQGYLVKEIANEGFLNFTLELVDLKPEESLILGRNTIENINKHYGKQILKLRTFGYTKDEKTGKRNGFETQFNVFVPAITTNYDKNAEDCKETKDLPKFYSQKNAFEKISISETLYR